MKFDNVIFKNEHVFKLICRLLTFNGGFEIVHFLICRIFYYQIFLGNVEIKNSIGQDRIMTKIKKQQMNWLGHQIKMDQTRLERR